MTDDASRLPSPSPKGVPFRPDVSGVSSRRHAPAIVMSEPTQCRSRSEPYQNKQDCASYEAACANPREGAFVIDGASPELGIGDERETGIQGVWIDRIANEGPRLEMGGEIVADRPPAYSPVDTPVYTAICRQDDGLIARRDPAHRGIRLRKRRPDDVPSRAAVITSEQPVGTRRP